MIDSHCHLADEAFEEDLDDVVARAKAADVAAALCILDPTSPDEQRRAVRVRTLWPDVQYAVGVHPHHAGARGGEVDRQLEDLLAHALERQPATCAIGEIGLDYHYDFAPRDVQQDVFRRQLRFAGEHRLPVVIHTREADDDTVAILEAEANGTVTGVFHCFAGDVALARRALDLGFFVSFSGIVTFRSAAAIREAARLVPTDRLLVETDAPYLAPVPHRGSRNEPSRLAHTLEVLAETRHEPFEVVREATVASFRTLFGDGV